MLLAKLTSRRPIRLAILTSQWPHTRGRAR